MKSPKDLVNEIAGAEKSLLSRYFIAPYVPGGKVVASVAGIPQIFQPVNANVGWNRFRLKDGLASRSGFTFPQAISMSAASHEEISTYLARLPILRMILAHPLQGQTWLAYPTNESDMLQKFGAGRPMPVHLVQGAVRLDRVIARIDGPVLWFEDVDRKSDARESDELRQELTKLTKLTKPDGLHRAGLTPEMLQAYALAYAQLPELQPEFRRRKEEERLRGALALGGGKLREFRDQGDVWAIEWTTRDGARHTSAVNKKDLTVTSAGLCLSGRDKDFDLQSLVGVVARRYTSSRNDRYTDADED